MSSENPKRWDGVKVLLHTLNYNMIEAGSALTPLDRKVIARILVVSNLIAIGSLAFLTIFKSQKNQK